MQENKYSRLPFELTFLRSEKKRLLDRILAGISHARNFFSEPLCNATAQFGTNFSITAFLCFMVGWGRARAPIEMKRKNNLHVVSLGLAARPLIIGTAEIFV